MSLKEKMALVKRDIELVEHNTAQSMSRLVQLDTVKTRMEATSNSLQEADNWTSLNADVEAAFEASDIERIGSILLGMVRSLAVLSNVPDYEERRARLASLHNQLEALVGPRLVEALASRRLPDTKFCLTIFADMNRHGRIDTYYNGCIKARVADLWRDCSAKAADGDLPRWLPLFYGRLTTLWRDEHTWVAQAFAEHRHDPQFVAHAFAMALQACAEPMTKALHGFVAERGTLRAAAG